MDVIHKFADANGLKSASTLPKTSQTQTMEVNILPVDKDIPVQSKADVGAIVQSLVGAIPYTNLALSEIREERLKRY